MPPSELRKEAREILKGKWGKAVCITLAFLAVSMLVGFVQGFLGEETLLYNIIEIAFLVVEVPLSFGLLVVFMKLKRNEEISAFDFFKEGFSRFGRSWGIWFHTFIRLLLPLICLILIVVLHFILMVANSSVQLNGIISIVYIVLLISTLIYIACRAFLYVLAQYVSFDNPELSSKESVLKSAELMKGHRGNYFMLELSFIGWTILAAFTLGVGMLWLMPYMQVSTICFYERVINKEKVK